MIVEQDIMGVQQQVAVLHALLVVIHANNQVVILFVKNVK
jgi:hypothetical protein